MIDVRSRLEKNSDPKYRSFHESLVPGIREVRGVRMPVLRSLCKEICKDDWRSFLESECTCYEETVLRALVIASAKMDTEERLERTRDFVPTIDNWAVCDVFCGSWKVNRENRAEVWDYCSELMESGDEFRMRVSSVMMLSHFIDDVHIDGILKMCSEHTHEGYYFRMGSAWLLSFCYVKYPQKTEDVLFSGGIEPDIRRKAVGKICDSYRVDPADKQRLKAKNKVVSEAD